MQTKMKCKILWRLFAERNCFSSSSYQSHVLKYCRNLNTSTASGDKDNVILMGSPGCGKTTVGKLLSAKLKIPAIDIDDDFLEPHWGKPVSEKLKECGSDRFVEEEGQALLQFKASGSVVSLTGSNPMHSEAMKHISLSGLVVFLDFPHGDILERLDRMKVNRIVGQEIGTPMSDILPYRQQFYEKSYDIRVLCEEGESAESVSNKVLGAIKAMQDDRGYVSTRQDNCGDRKSLSDVVLQGLAPDGGLYVPSMNIPSLSLGEWNRLVSLNYCDRALRILEKLINPYDLHPSKLKEFLNNAYNSETFNCGKVFPVRHLLDNQYLLELFHGPTASFKDAALQLLPQFFVEALKQNKLFGNTKYIILVATSGDTGGAVLDGFHRQSGSSGVGVVVLFPEDGISEVQKIQMTSMSGGNIHVLGVEGDFDACQSIVKKVFRDQDLLSWLSKNGNYRLSAANSISWGRLVPQIVYQASAYLDLVQNGVVSVGEEVDLCVPTGNFGNILSAYYAKQMGIPFRRLICASNSNNALTQFINSGVYDVRSRQLQKTASPAIDILVSSNLERFLYHISGRDSAVVRLCFNSLDESRFFTVPEKVLEDTQQLFVAKWCSEKECVRTIKSCLENTGYLLDPHTAVAKFVGDRFNTKDVPMIVAATAHYSKFGPEMLRYLGHEEDVKEKSMVDRFDLLHKITKIPPVHQSLEECVKMSKGREKILKADYSNVVQEIKKFSQSL